MSIRDEILATILVCAPDCDTDTQLTATRLPDDALLYADPPLRGGLYVIAKPDAYPDGSLVIASLGEGVRVVRFLFWEGAGRVRLEAAHADFESLSFDADQVVIEGRVFRVCVSCTRGECFALDRKV